LRPCPFEYFAASTVNEALDLISTKEDAKILAGKQSLLAVMRLRLLASKTIIDIGRIRELAYVREDTGTVKIGALTTHDTLENNQIIRANCVDTLRFFTEHKVVVSRW
jgi:carbon-monoxide dehydrogenase medium subunit